VTPDTTFTTTDPANPALRRELGRWDLTAIGVNQVIGGAVFAVPAALAANADGWSPWMVAAVGLASMLIALSFAEVGSRFEGTGGPYLYTRAAFGGFAGFEVGWLLWVTRAASWAAVVNVLATSLGFYWPALIGGTPRMTLIAAIVAAITIINVRGIRQSSLVVNALTIGKIAPLLLFIAVGVFYVDSGVLWPTRSLTFTELSASALLLIFAFGGYEVVPVPAGEARDPRRGVPFALVMTIVVVTAIMTLAQVVALGTLPDLASSRTPLADAAARFLGATGAALITIGAVFSTTGNNMGQALSGPRNLFALAEQGDLPRFFGKVHPQYRTPVNSILFTSCVALALALSGTFTVTATVSAISRLLVYAATCASVLRLRSPLLADRVRPANFTLPFGPLIPSAAIVIALAILAGATTTQLIGGGAAVAAGALLYVMSIHSRERL
jgi:basic amino acid/polyamine antiporter, APA family